MSFSALPVLVLYYVKSRESWIPPYVGIQITTGIYTVIDVLYNGAFYLIAPSLSTAFFTTAQTLLRAFFLILIPLFLERLFDLPGKKTRRLLTVISAVYLIVWTAFSTPERNHLSPFYLAGAVASILLACHVVVTALSLRNRLSYPMKSINRLFILAGPIYIAYLLMYTLFPFFTGRVFRTGSLSFTNMAYGIWNIIFLRFLVNFMTRHPSETDRKDNLEALFSAYSFTDREMAILSKVVEGLGNKQIAAELEINENTVKAHLYNAYTKIGIHTRVELMKVVYADSEETVKP
ncbi:MAG: helix-turn-helix transcriptional regulator [Spirochaetales bacterium]|nr:helix-turn-helix transcriptional regulator [Spirochaetales bacterium]